MSHTSDNTEKGIAKRIAEILLAFSEGKQIERKKRHNGPWVTYTSEFTPDITYRNVSYWRIKSPAPQRKWSWVLEDTPIQKETYDPDRAAKWKSLGYKVVEWVEVL